MKIHRPFTADKFDVDSQEDFEDQLADAQDVDFELTERTGYRIFRNINEIADFINNQEGHLYDVLTESTNADGVSLLEMVADMKALLTAIKDTTYDDVKAAETLYTEHEKLQGEDYANARF